MSSPRVLIAAGGTGGHVFPALAVAQELDRCGWHAEWVGTDRGLEARVIPTAGFTLHILRFTGLRGKGLAAWLTLPLRLMRALLDARDIVKRVRPSVVVAFGGYVTFPVGLAARWLRIPLCIHEQNAVMGSANRWLSKIAQAVMVSFPGTRHAPLGAALVGNPVRAAIEQVEAPQARYAARTGAIRILVMGGSLGASVMNQQLPLAFQVAAERGARLEVWHQTGTRDLAAVQANYQQLGIDARCTAFIDEVPAAYAWADLLICRAGASTVSEVALAGVAALFIPLPHAIDDHQSANARTLSDRGAAWLLTQSACTPQALGERLAGLDRAALAQLATLAASQGMPQAAQQAASLVAATAGSPLEVKHVAPGEPQQAHEMQKPQSRTQQERQP